MVFRCQIPAFPGDTGFQTELTVLIDGIEMQRRMLNIGDFEVRVPVSGATGSRVIECRFSHARPLPAPDTRMAAARLMYLGFEPKK